MCLHANFDLPDKEEIIIPMESINGLVIFEAEINHLKGKFILDTGADAFLVNQKEIIGSSSRVSFGNLSQELISKEVRISSFNLGGVEHTELDAFTIDMTAVEAYLGKDIKGIIGFNFFMPNTLSIDFNKNLITISNSMMVESEAGMSSFDFTFVDEIPVASVFIDNKKFAFALDSGASMHVVDQKVVKKYNKIFRDDLDKVSLITASGETENISKVFCQNVFIADVSLGNSHFLIQDFSSINESLTTEISGILSLSTIADSKIIFQTSHNKVYYK